MGAAPADTVTRAHAPGELRSPARRLPGRGLAWRWIGTRLLLLFPLVQLLVSMPREGSNLRDTDLYPLYVHAERVRSAEPLYWPWPEYGPHYMEDGLRYPPERQPYPPFLTPALSLLSRYGLLAFAQVWTLLLFAAYWVYAASLAKLATGQVTLGATLLAGIALFALTGRAAQSAVNLGNVDPILWALFGSALAFPAVRGVGFMGIALVKLYGAWPLALAVWLRERRTLRSAGWTLAAGVAASVAVLGAAGFVEALHAWATTMLPVLGQGTFNPYNLSLSFLGLRIARAAGWAYEAGPLPAAFRLYLTLAGVGAPLAVLWLTRHREPVLRYALVLCAAVFFAPLAWNFYTPLLLAPGAILLRLRHSATSNVSLPCRPAT